MVGISSRQLYRPICFGVPRCFIRLGRWWRRRKLAIARTSGGRDDRRRLGRGVHAIVVAVLLHRGPLPLVLLGHRYLLAGAVIDGPWSLRFRRNRGVSRGLEGFEGSRRFEVELRRDGSRTTSANRKGQGLNRILEQGA